MAIDHEQMTQEDAIWPWLASDCIAELLEEDETFYSESDELDSAFCFD
jgi:hypothetical protein